MIDLFPLASMQLLADMAKTGLTIQPKEIHGKNKQYICSGLRTTFYPVIHHSAIFAITFIYGPKVTNA